MRTKLTNIASARVYRSRKLTKNGDKSNLLICEVIFANVPEGANARKTFAVVGKEAAEFANSCYSQLDKMLEESESSAYSRRRRGVSKSTNSGTPALILDPNSLYYFVNKTEFEGEVYEQETIVMAKVIDTAWIDSVAEAEEAFNKFEKEESVKLTPVWGKDGKLTFVEEKPEPAPTPTPTPAAKSTKKSTKSTKK